VLNNPALVAPETAQRVNKAIRELSYHPNVFAQGLMTRRSRLIGLALPDIHGEFYSEILRGADTEARRLGYHLLVSSEVDDGEGGLVSSPAAGLIGGLVVMVTEPNQKLWREARNAEVPVVVIDRDVHESGVDSVLIDNEKGTREAVLHLLGSVAPGRCYFIGGPQTNFDTIQRSRAFAQVIQDRAGAVAKEQVVFREYSVEWGEQAVLEILGRGSEQPVGILAANDEIAYGALRAAQQMGVGVPWKLRVVGFDDSRLAGLSLPRLSSVRVPRAEVGAAAIATLVRRMEHRDAPVQSTPLPTTLVVRESSVPVERH
jgi:LacI family transcriptional regulator